MTIVAGFLIDNGPQITEVANTLALTNSRMLILAGISANIALQVTDLSAKLTLSNRGTAIGIKDTTTSFNYDVAAAVLERRNTLAGPDDVFPVPPRPPGV
jgi:hypothetical protein